MRGHENDDRVDGGYSPKPHTPRPARGRGRLRDHEADVGSSARRSTVIGALEPARRRRGPLFLNCPRCGLSIQVRAQWLVVEHCPRCLARARIAVILFSSPLSAEGLYAEGSAPSADRHTGERVLG